MLVDLALEVDDSILIHPRQTSRVRLFAIPYPVRQRCWRSRLDRFPVITGGRSWGRGGIGVNCSVVAGEEFVRLGIRVEGERCGQVRQGEGHVPVQSATRLMTERMMIDVEGTLGLTLWRISSTPSSVPSRQSDP